MDLRKEVPRPRRRHNIWSRLSSPSSVALIGLNLVVCFFLGHWAVNNLRPESLADQFSRVPAWALLGSFAINFASLFLYGSRMSMLLGCSFKPAFAIVNIGYALNSLIPLRLGEAAKMYLAHRFFSTPMVAIFAASVTEKIVDLATLLLLAVIVAGFAARSSVPLSALLPVFVLLFLALVTVAVFRRNIIQIVKLLPKGGRLRRISIELHKHAGSYPWAHVLLISVAIWIANIALVYFSFSSFLPDTDVGVLDSIVLLLILALAIAVPGAPAGIGLFEAGMVAYLTQKAGTGNEAALVAATLFHLVITLPHLVVAAWAMWGAVRNARARTSAG